MKSIIPSIEKISSRPRVNWRLWKNSSNRKEEPIESIRRKKRLFILTFRCLSRELEKGSEVVRILRAWLSIIATYVRTHIAMTVFRDTDFRIDYVTISGRFLANQFTRLRYKNGLDPEKSIHHGYDFQITLSNRYLSASSLTLPYLTLSHLTSRYSVPSLEILNCQINFQKIKVGQRRKITSLVEFS